MRLKKFDLNLLVVLDVLLTEQSTTRAAQRLNLSQPAVSSSLARLREYYGDELLVPVGRGLAPTALGKSLAASVREILIRAGAALDARADFNPAREHRKFRLMCSDYTSAVLLAEVAKRSASLAPGIALEISPSLLPAESVNNGDADLLILPAQYLSPDHPHEVLYEETSACLVWNGNPLVDEDICLEQYLSLGHVVASLGNQPGRSPSSVDKWLYTQLGERRRIEIVVPDFSSIPLYIVDTNRIGTVHRRLAVIAARRMPLKVLDAPLAIPSTHLSMQWNFHHDNDGGVVWLRELVRSTVLDIGEMESPSLALA